MKLLKHGVTARTIMALIRSFAKPFSVVIGPSEACPRWDKAAACSSAELNSLRTSSYHRHLATERPATDRGSQRRDFYRIKGVALWRRRVAVDRGGIVGVLPGARSGTAVLTRSEAL